MKRKNNFYNEIVDIKKIIEIYDKKVKLNTKNKIKLEKFENNYVSNIICIKNILEAKKYIPGKYNIFIIKEPKVRLIMSQNIIDKIINHLVSKYFLVNIFENTLINENIATRKDKGTHYGIKLLKKYINELKNEKFYILKFDISKYFYNLDHKILKQLVRRKIKDNDVVEIIDNIIDSTDKNYVNEEINLLKQREISKIINCTDNNKLIQDILNIPEYKTGKGLPIGNMSSQILAILYLNELDHYIKEKLNIRYYIRYMDDGIILHKDKEYLKKCLTEIKIILDKYHLNLNNKTKIISINEGFEFLGFRYFIKNNKLIMKVKNQTKRKFKRKIKKLNKLVDKGIIDEFNLIQVINSYQGHLNYGNTANLLRKTIYKPNFLNYQEVRIINEDIIYK